MKNIVKAVALAGLLASTALTGAQAADQNPIFGGAKVTTLSATDNAKVAGKGANANYWGYYGESFLSYAANQAYYARYIYASNSANEYNAYYNAYYYGYYGSLYSYYAYYYSVRGQ